MFIELKFEVSDKLPICFLLPILAQTVDFPNLDSTKASPSETEFCVRRKQNSKGDFVVAVFFGNSFHLVGVGWDLRIKVAPTRILEHPHPIS